MRVLDGVADDMNCIDVQAPACCTASSCAEHDSTVHTIQTTSTQLSIAMPCHAMPCSLSPLQGGSCPCTHLPHVCNEVAECLGQLPLEAQGVDRVDVCLKCTTEEHAHDGHAVHQALQAAVHEAGVAQVLQPNQTGAAAGALRKQASKQGRQAGRKQAQDRWAQAWAGGGDGPKKMHRCT